jgi:hypothetical protein
MRHLFKDLIVKIRSSPEQTMPPIVHSVYWDGDSAGRCPRPAISPGVPHSFVRLSGPAVVHEIDSMEQIQLEG